MDYSPVITAVDLTSDGKKVCRTTDDLKTLLEKSSVAEDFLFDQI